MLVVWIIERPGRKVAAVLTDDSPCVALKFYNYPVERRLHTLWQIRGHPAPVKIMAHMGQHGPPYT